MPDNAKKYLLYATGEILLVVIGILIALQVNNWNENRKGTEASRGYLNEILSDLESDTLELGNKIRSLEKRIEFERWYLNKTNYTVSDTDSISQAMGGTYYDFYINDNTYMRIQNSGESQLTGFDELNEKIGNYYSVVKIRALKNTEYEIREATRQTPLTERMSSEIDLLGLTDRNVWGNTLSPSFKPVQSESESKERFLAIAESIAFRNRILQIHLRHQYILDGFKYFNEEASQLINDINTALQ